VTTADGRLLLFSALNNNYTVPTRRVDQVTDALSNRLATLRLDPQ
jgi:D-alanyl-D-alanine carboxypeptidase